MALELHDDYETLEAALALIDSWELEASDSSTDSACDDSSSVATATDSEDQSSTSSQSPGSSPPLAPASTTSKTTGNTRRRKTRSDEAGDPQAVAPVQMQRREELVFLRRKIRELETQLTTLQEDAVTTIADSLSTRPVDASWVWQQIALRQLEHRQKSETENARLRVLVEEQVSVAKELMRVLMQAYKQQQNDKANGEEGAGSAKRIKLPRGGLAEISVEDQLRRCQELYDERATAFTEPPYSTNQVVFREVNVLEHANGEATINVDSSWVVPFPVDKVTNAFWKYLARKVQRMDCGFDGCFDDDKDEVVTRYEATTAATRLVGKFVGRFVGRRYRAEENKPALMVWDLRAEPVDFKPMSMDGVQLHHETIMRVVYADEINIAQDAKTPPACGGTRMSVVQMSTRVRIKFAAAETPTRKRRVDALTNYLFYNVESELEWKQDVLETLLLKDAMQPSSITA